MLLSCTGQRGDVVMNMTLEEWGQGKWSEENGTRRYLIYVNAHKVSLLLLSGKDRSSY